MTPAQILATLQLGGTLIEYGMRQYTLLKQNGQLTDEQRAQIDAAAQASREAWDDAIAAAKERLAEDEG